MPIAKFDRSAQMRSWSPAFKHHLAAEHQRAIDERRNELEMARMEREIARTSRSALSRYAASGRL